MEPAREGEDKFAGSLVDAVHAHAAFRQLHWRNQRHKVLEQVWAVLKERAGVILGSGVKCVVVTRWHAIPRLDCANVVVIDGGRVQVLRVPAEAREPHAGVQPRHAHPRDGSVKGLWHAAVCEGQVDEVPRMRAVAVVALLVVGVVARWVPVVL